MKSLLMLMLMLCASCLDAPPLQTPQSAAEPDEAVPLPHTGDATTDSACTNTCESRYDACLLRAISATEECLCRNQHTICVRSCGSPAGGLETCPT
jgi:hypothetical protein